MGGSPVVCGDSIQPLCQPAPSVAMGDKRGPGAACAASASANPSWTAYHACGLMHTRNKDWFMWTTGSARRVLGPWAAMAAAGVLAVAAAAQPASPPSGQAAPAAGGLAMAWPTEPPTPRATLAAYNAVEAWVRAWAAPGAETPLPADLPACYGACVHLRLNGVLVGRGVAMVTSATEPASAAFIREATDQAIRTANPRLPAPNDLSRDDAVKLLTPDIQISLELAGAPMPIVDDSWGLIDPALAPGLDGLLVRREGAAAPQGVAAEFPSQMMLAGGLPQKSIRTLTAQVIGEGGAAEVLLMPREIRDKHAVKMYRFRVSHVAQGGPRRRPEFLYRGARTPVSTPMSAGELRTMADGLAGHLRWRAKAARGTAGFVTLDAVRGTWADAADTAGSALLATLAMREFVEYSRAGGEAAHADPLGAREALQADGAEIQSPIAWSLAAQIAWPGPGREEDAALSVRAAKRITRSLAGDTRATSAPVPPRPDSQPAGEPEPFRFEALNLVERSVMLWSISRLPTPDAGQLSEAIRRQFVSVGSDRLVMVMPWLGWAEVRAADLRRRDPDKFKGAAGNGSIPSGVALRAMRDEVWKHQLTALDATDDSADMIGGIVFTSGNTTPLPTWQCVRPLAFMATMLGDDRLTEPQERALELARLLQAMRFLRQLQVDDSCGWMYANPEAAIGGIRGAVWDHTLNPDATSMALLAVVELLKSMDRIAPEMLKDAAAPGAADPAGPTSGKP